MKKAIYLIAIWCLAVLMIGCGDNKKEEKPGPGPEPEEIEIGPYETNITDAEVETFNGFGIEMEVQEFDEDTYLFEGDILIDKDRKPPLILEEGEQPPRKAAARVQGFWPNNKFYYDYHTNITSNTKSEIQKAIDWFHSNSNIQFIQEKHANGYVLFQNGSGCSSFVGFLGRQAQPINLSSNGCGFGSTVHEIMHALGFWHEQSRADRDAHIRIVWENVTAGTEHNFGKYPASGASAGQDIGEFDFASLMMYHSKAFSKNGLATIVRVNGLNYFAQRTAPSETDKMAINKLYPKPTPPPTPTEPTPPPAPEYVVGKTYQLYGLWVVYTGEGGNRDWIYNHRTNGWWYVVYRQGLGWYYHTRYYAIGEQYTVQGKQVTYRGIKDGNPIWTEQITKKEEVVTVVEKTDWYVVDYVNGQWVERGIWKQ